MADPALKILIIEDVEADAWLVFDELRRGGLDCEFCRVDTERDFLARLSESAQDIIISDFSMPHLDGMTALKIARQRAPNTPFIFVSGKIGEEIAVDSLKHGATDYVLKHSLLRLVPAVKRALEEARGQRAREAAEAELARSEQRYRGLFQSIPHPMWVYDTQTLRFLEASDVAVARYGFSRDEFLSMTVADICPEQDRYGLRERTTEPPGGIGPQPSQHRTKDGRLIDVEISSRDVMLEGRPARIVVASDVTERKQAEQRLVQSEEKYRQLIEEAPDGIFLSDRDGNVLMANRRGCELLGYAEEELLGLNGEVTYVEHEVPLRRERLSQIHAGQTLHFERMVKRKDGSTFPAEVRLKMLDEDRMQAIFHDITTRRGHEEKIARMSRIHGVLSGINSAIVRIRERKELFHEACRIAVEHGHFRMAWIGVLNQSTMKVEAMACAGFEDGFLDSFARLSVDEDVFEGHGMPGRALRTKRPVIANDFASDPQIVFKAEALARGYRSGIALPLIVGEQAVGLISLYATETNFFDDGELKLLSELASDISFAMQYIEKEEQLNYLAYYDPLTGLANRSLLKDRLRQTLQFAERYTLTAAVLVIDLDRFKLVNDTLGHAAGDELLKIAGSRISAAVRKMDTVTRLGGDEFVVLLAGMELDEHNALQIANRIVEALCRPLVLAGRELYITCSVGGALYPRDGEDGEALLANADAAMYRAKERGRNNCQFYVPEARNRVDDRLSLEAALRRALEREEFRLHYQPQVDLTTGHIFGLEALIRWERPELGMVSPARFIPIAEETGLILPIGEWVLRAASLQTRAWHDQGLPHIRIGVNLSAQQFRQANLARRIQAVLDEAGLDPKHLEVELTESMLMQNVEPAIAIMMELRSVGVQISLDDFGTGYSSLSYLKRFPIDTVKIDQSFVREITADPDSAAIADAIIAMAHSLHLLVLAEGVETEGQLALLRARGCDRMQGYLFSKPLPPDQVVQVLRERRCLAVPAIAGEDPTLLLVDDDPSVLATLERVLDSRGYRILLAESPKAAFEVLARNTVQVIVSDQRMPEMNGTEFFGRVKDLYPGTVRIMLSGYSEIQSVADAANRGSVYKFLSKPWNDAELRATIDEAFGRVRSEER